MTTHTIRKGFDLKIAGRPEPTVEQAPEPQMVAVSPREFPGLKPKLLVKEGETVATGQPLFLDKTRPGLHFPSPATGRVSQIALGARRFPERVEITPEGEERFAEVPRLDPGKLDALTRDQLFDALKGSGMWTYIMQRPVGKIARRKYQPVAIFVNGMDTEPLAADPAVLVAGHGEYFQLGLDVVRRLTDGPVYLTIAAAGDAPAEFRAASGVEIHEFAGPHPAGLVGTHISCVRPLKAEEVVWCLRAQDVVHIGEWAATGRYPTHRTVAVSGSAAPKRCYMRVRQGAALTTLTGGTPLSGDVRVINGTVLSGTQVEPTGSLSFYAQTLTVIPQGAGVRDLFGWALPQFGKFSASRSVFGWLRPKPEYVLDARLNGGVRNIVNIGAWDNMTPLDIHPTYLLRAIQAGDLEEAINLGLLEVTEEDVALCTYADPCKTEVGEVIRKGLDMFEEDS